MEFGCWAYDNCDTCPFPDCWEANPLNVRKFHEAQKVMSLSKAGLSQEEIAQSIGLSRQTVIRRFGVATSTNSLADLRK